MNEVLYSMRAEVRADGSLEIWQDNQRHVGFARTREALVIVRDELDRLITDGPSKCPFRNT